MVERGRERSTSCQGNQAPPSPISPPSSRQSGLPPGGGGAPPGVIDSCHSNRLVPSPFCQLGFFFQIISLPARIIILPRKLSSRVLGASPLAGAGTAGRGRRGGGSAGGRGKEGSGVQPWRSRLGRGEGEERGGRASERGVPGGSVRRCAPPRSLARSRGCLRSAWPGLPGRRRRRVRAPLPPPVAAQVWNARHFVSDRKSARPGSAADPPAGSGPP